jgi:hypothetical protein
LLVLLVAAVQPWPAMAQRDGSLPLGRPAAFQEPGDVLWTFAQEPPFYDARVAMAVATLIDAELRPAGVRLFYAEAQGPDVVAHVDAPIDDVQLLLAAAGFPEGLGDLDVVGPCLVWADAALAVEVAQLAELLSEALAEISVEADACETTERPTDALVLLWPADEGQPPIPIREFGVFLAFPQVSPRPPSQVAPPTSGDAGLKLQE